MIDLKMDYADVLEVLQKCRSIRRFKQDPVPEDMVHQIIAAARLAPSGF